MNAPTCEELYNEKGFKIVDKSSDSGWRHGTIETLVYKREADSTFWKTIFALSADCETNELREGSAPIHQVFPKEKTVTVYE